jgi:hypothetical protein
MAIGLLEQMRVARSHPWAAAMGGALGGFVPIAAYVISHLELRDADGRMDLWKPIAPVLLACLFFSVSTVWQWGVQSFRERFKASCLVIAIEGVMVLSSTPILSVVALAYLVLINAIATACTLVAEDQPIPQPTVSSVARELSLPRRAAAKVVDQHLAARASQRPRPAV